MRPPEPCLNDRCRSPVACNGWGYCRERNMPLPGEPSASTVARFRAEAARRVATTPGDTP